MHFWKSVQVKKFLINHKNKPSVRDYKLRACYTDFTNLVSGVCGLLHLWLLTLLPFQPSLGFLGWGGLLLSLVTCSAKDEHQL